MRMELSLKTEMFWYPKGVSALLGSLSWSEGHLISQELI